MASGGHERADAARGRVRQLEGARSAAGVRRSESPLLYTSRVSPTTSGRRQHVATVRHACVRTPAPRQVEVAIRFARRRLHCRERRAAYAARVDAAHGACAQRGPHTNRLALTRRARPVGSLKVARPLSHHPTPARICAAPKARATSLGAQQRDQRAASRRAQRRAPIECAPGLAPPRPRGKNRGRGPGCGAGARMCEERPSSMPVRRAPRQVLVPAPRINPQTQRTNPIGPLLPCATATI